MIKYLKELKELVNQGSAFNVPKTKYYVLSDCSVYWSYETVDIEPIPSLIPVKTKYAPQLEMLRFAYHEPGAEKHIIYMDVFSFLENNGISLSENTKTEAIKRSKYQNHQRDKIDTGGSIYLITNNVNGKTYVGQTVRDPRTRIHGHLTQANKIGKDKSHCHMIHRAIHKYGKENFSFQVLVTGIKSQEELDRLEKLYIEKYKSHYLDHGYNMTYGGNSATITSACTFTPDEAEYIRQLLKYSDITMDELSDIAGCSNNVLRNINNGHSYYSPEYEYPIRSIKQRALERLLLDKETYENIKNDLQNDELKTHEIANKYGFSTFVIQKINRGDPRYIEKYNDDVNLFPIRIGYTFAQKLYDVTYALIYNDESLQAIATKANMTLNGVSLISIGRTYHYPFLVYPLRTNRTVNQQIVAQIGIQFLHPRYIDTTRQRGTGSEEDAMWVTCLTDEELQKFTKIKEQFTANTISTVDDLKPLIESDFIRPMAKYEEGYFIARDGTVYSTRTSNTKTNNGTITVLVPQIKKVTNKATSFNVTISPRDRTGKRHFEKHAKLLAETFIENPDNLPYVVHIDGDPRHNTVDNLKWSLHRDVQDPDIKKQIQEELNKRK